MSRFDGGSSRRIVAGSMLGVGVVLALVLFVIANYFGSKYAYRFDWTSEELYSLSDKTLNVLEGLPKDVEVVVFVSPGEALYGPITELLEAYASASDRVSVRTVDAGKNLVEAQSLVDRYEISQLGVTVFDAGDDRRVVNTADLADYDYSGMQTGQGPQMTGFKGEQVFTSTLVELMESRKPKIVLTTGHGELSLDDMSERGFSSARELLGRDNFELEEWFSLGATAVPEETDLVVIAGPTSTFVEPELETLRTYLDGGGRLVALLDPTLAPNGGLVETGLEQLVGEFGVQVGSNIVVDPSNPLPFFGAETIFVNVYDDHVITRPLDQAQLPVIVPLARSVGKGDEIEGLEVTELMRTSIDGWGETDLDNLDQIEFHQGVDLEGPVPLAVAVERSAGAGTEPPETSRQKLRMVVVGDSDFASNSQLQNVPNATLLANMLNWLVDREVLVGIPPKQPEQVRLSLSSSELSRISWLVLIILPGLALVLGLVVYLRRRR